MEFLKKLPAHHKASTACFDPLNELDSSLGLLGADYLVDSACVKNCTHAQRPKDRRVSCKKNLR